MCQFLVAAQATATEHASLDVQQLMADLATVKSAVVTFTETKTLAVLKEPLTLTGQLSYKAPNYLQKKVLSPTPSTYTVTGSQVDVTEYNQPPKSFSLDDSSLLEALIVSMRATLAGDLARLKLYYDVSLSGSMANWRLELIPSDHDVEVYIRQILIRGSHTHLQSIETIESNDNRTVMLIDQGAP